MLDRISWLVIGLSLALIAVVCLVAVIVILVPILTLVSTTTCWPQARVERLPDYLLGHYGPVWGRVEGGDVIVFAWDEGLLSPIANQYGGSLYSVRPDGTGLTLLSPSVGDGRELGCYGAPLDDRQLRDYRVAFDTSPAISPDGTRVAYVTERQGVYQARLDIVTVELGSGDLRRVTPARQPGLELGTQYGPAWSPDGMRIAFLEAGGLRTMAVDGSGARSIAPDLVAAPEPPAWSPDGTRIAFRGWNSNDPGWALYIVGAYASNPQRALEGITGAEAELADSSSLRLPLSYGGPVWSPDGRRIALLRTVVRVESQLEVSNDVHVLDVETGTIEAVLKNAVGPLLWSPDGTELLFFAQQPPPLYAQEPPPRSGPAIYAVTVHGDPVVRRFARLSPNWITGMSWSPDGAWLAVRTVPRSYDGVNQVVLWTVAADGSVAWELVRVSSLDGALRGRYGEPAAAGEAE